MGRRHGQGTTAELHPGNLRRKFRENRGALHRPTRGRPFRMPVFLRNHAGCLKTGRIIDLYALSPMESPLYGHLHWGVGDDPTGGRGGVPLIISIVAVHSYSTIHGDSP